MTGKQSVAPPSSTPALRQKVHVQVKYRGQGPPGPQLRERCDTLVKLIEQADAGVIEAQKVGGGAVDIYVITRFPQHTMDTARRIAMDLSIAPRLNVKIVVEG